MAQFSGAALWAKKEAHAGDRLPYGSFVDENTVLLRDGAVMLSLAVPGFAFETADSDEINVDDDAIASRPVGEEGGFWVQGWLWCSDEEA